MTKLAELEEDKTERLRDLDEERTRMLAWVQESGERVRAEIDSLVGQVVDDDITFSPNDTVVVRTGETVKADHLTALSDVAKVFLDQFESDMADRQKTVAEPLDNEIDRVRAEMQAASLQVDAGDEGVDAEGERERDVLKIKRIEGIKPLQTLNE